RGRLPCSRCSRCSAPTAPTAPAPLAAPAAKPATLLDELVASLAQALFRPADTIDAERGFEAAGLDPIVADERLPPPPAASAGARGGE
ncbi:hypothetical protein, partial [Burkholderia pseudomallei]|uniref:hypothetical protein n=1 Tax=Burkholderia pseudomallei TaxID=28450 RepID=UPI0011773291